MNAPLAAMLACLCCHAATAPVDAVANGAAPARLIATTAAVADTTTATRLTTSRASAPVLYASAERRVARPAAPAPASEEPKRPGSVGRSLAVALALMAGIALRRWGSGHP